MANVPVKQSVAFAGEMLSDLYLLVHALDRRVPHLERSGETTIARDAADLRRRAISLIQQLEVATPLQ